MPEAAIVELDLSGSDDCVPSEMDPDREGLVYGSHITSDLRLIDAACAAIGTASLRKFIIPIDEVTDEDARSKGSVPEQRTLWFDPNEALSIVRSLEQHFAGLDDEGRRRYESYRFSLEGILWDLKAYRLHLERALRSNQQFRIVL